MEEQPPPSRPEVVQVRAELVDDAPFDEGPPFRHRRMDFVRSDGGPSCSCGCLLVLFLLFALLVGLKTIFGWLF